MKDLPTKNFIAPDGGWGWIIVFAYGLANFLIMPMPSGFVMIYSEKFEEMDISATKLTIIVNMNLAFGLILSIFYGPLLRIYGYRKISIAAQLIYSSGLILTSFATCFSHFIITFGIIVSVGQIMITASTCLALNVYFKKKRSRAVGLSLTITGIGQIVLPQLISYMLSNYDSKGTLFIIGAISLNHLVGGLLLQPIKWHAKEVKDVKANSENEIGQIKNKFTKYSINREAVIDDTKSENKQKLKINHQIIAIFNDRFNDKSISVSKYDSYFKKKNCVLNVQDWLPKQIVFKMMEDNKKIAEKLSTDNSQYVFKRSNSLNEIKSRKFSFISLNQENIAMANTIYSQRVKENEELKRIKAGDQMENGTLKPTESSTTTDDPQSMNKSWSQILVHQIVQLFDLELVKNYKYMILAVGLSIVMFAEINFNNLMPLILAEKNLNIQSIAAILSTVGFSDLVLRGLSPYIGEWLHISPMVMFLFSLVMLVLARTVLLFITSYSALLILACFMGVGKGIKIVYINVLIPNCVPINKLPGANSIQMLLNGFTLLFASPLGYIKDVSGSYYMCIVTLNFVTVTMILLFVTDFIFSCIKKRRKRKTTYKLKQSCDKCVFNDTRDLG